MSRRPPPPLSEREHVVYRFYDADGRLLYVGMTSDLPARLRQHASDKPWWPQVARTESERHSSQGAAAAAEALAIITERPMFNVSGAGVDLDDLVTAVRARLRAQRRDRLKATLRAAATGHGLNRIMYVAMIVLLEVLLADMYWELHDVGAYDRVCAAGVAVSSYLLCAMAPATWRTAVLSVVILAPLMLNEWLTVGKPQAVVFAAIIGGIFVVTPRLNPAWHPKPSRREAGRGAAA